VAIVSKLKLLKTLLRKAQAKDKPDAKSATRLILKSYTAHLLSICDYLNPTESVANPSNSSYLNKRISLARTVATSIHERLWTLTI
jgi:hypothetical protein